MTNKGIIAAALILGGCILAGAVLPIHHQELKRREAAQKAACMEDRASFDRCYSTPPPAPGYEQKAYDNCKAIWQPLINHSCYGMPEPTSLPVNLK